MMNHFLAMVSGNSPTGRQIRVFAPFDEKFIASLETADLATVDKALATAESLYKDRSQWLSVDQRVNILTKTVELMRLHAESLALDAAHEGGKPLKDSRVEVERAIDGVKICIDCLLNHAGREIPMNRNAASANRVAFTQFEPIGPVVAVSAFNHPLNLIVHQVAPAIAAGNPVIVKPAEDTPLSCYRFVSLLQQAGLPSEWCQALVVDDLEVASALVTDHRVAFFSFIGSAKVGWMLRSKLAPGTRCALEHGGVAPVILTENANLEQAIPLLAKGGFYHAGQVCVSVQRIYCHQSIAKEVASRLAEYVQNLRVGDPCDENTDIGPLIRAAEVQRISDWIVEARQAGAKILCGGTPLSDSCFSPTVIYDPPPTVKVSQQEIFGPVVCIYPFDEIEQAIERANDVPFAFQAAVFTQNIDEALTVSRHLNASAVMVNDHTAFRVDWMPFAGLGQSGLGVGGIPNTFHEMQTEKMTVIHSPAL